VLLLSGILRCYDVESGSGWGCPHSRVIVSRNLYWIWFVGSAAWFLDAALVLHRGALARGLLAVAVSAMFLVAGMFFKKQAGR